MQHFTKRGLYLAVARIREEYSVTEASYPLNVIDFIGNSFDNIAIDEMRIRTKGLRGIASLSGDPDVSHCIILDAGRTVEEKNFDCGHELMHILLHNNGEGQEFHCYEKALPTQNAFYEWQANEGSAELVVPSRLMFPYITKDRITSRDGILSLKYDLANDFGVSVPVITYRFESLRYEIYQYIQGKRMDQIVVMSSRKQKEMGISVRSLNELESDYWNDELSAWHSRTEMMGKGIRICAECGSASSDHAHCAICGSGDADSTGGVRAVKYAGLEEKNGRLVKCPKCENEQISEKDKHCMICGAYLLNVCASKVDNADRTKECDNKLPSNARYCPQCGTPTTYYLCGWLPQFHIENPAVAKNNDVIPAIEDSDDLPF